MTRQIQILLLLLVPLSNLHSQGITQEKDHISIEYLGHSCFYIDFFGEVSVLTDYGKPDAYKEYGWSSPIRRLEDLHPDILTYSHRHEDHYDPDRVKELQAISYFGDSLMQYKGLTITPIDVSEADKDSPDNHAYLFTYNDLRVLHLGDCQSNIMAIRDETHRNYLLKHLPGECHITFVPVEGPTRFTEELLEFMQMLDTEVVIPMHYWSAGYKDSLLHLLEPIGEQAGFQMVDLSHQSYHFRKQYSNFK